MNEKILKSLIYWSKGIKQPPDQVQIYPTNKCNLNCLFCCQQLGEYNIHKDVTKKKWLEVAEELCTMGVKNILISGGGEPLLSNATIEMMELFKKNNVIGRMIHNGTLWTDTLINRTISIGWDSLIFSIDGLEKTHDFLRGKKDSFSKIIENIRRFNYIKLKLNKIKPIIETTTVLTVYNYKEIPNFVMFADSLDIKNITVEPVCVNNPSVEKMKLNKEQRTEFLEKILPKAEKIAKQRGISTNFHKLKEVKVIEKTGNLKDEILKGNKQINQETFIKNLPESLKRFINLPCYEPWLWPKIEANGEVWPCSTVPLKENIKEKSFREIWYGSEFAKFRDRIMNKDLPESCSNCVLTHLETNSKIRNPLLNLIQTK